MKLKSSSSVNQSSSGWTSSNSCCEPSRTVFLDSWKRTPPCCCRGSFCLLLLVGKDLALGRLSDGCFPRFLLEPRDVSVSLALVDILDKSSETLRPTFFSAPAAASLAAALGGCPH